MCVPAVRADDVGARRRWPPRCCLLGRHAHHRADVAVRDAVERHRRDDERRARRRARGANGDLRVRRARSSSR
ncbi:MAG: hypothetical protein MZV64_30855 [Ignavibacteriales bacterium]|nr:hypothetical protein [Ignavibacteriales bacterium]